MSLQGCHLSVLLLLLGLSMGCPTPPQEAPRETIETEDEDNDVDESENNDVSDNVTHSEVDAGPMITGSITGRVINRGSEPLSGMKIMACCSTICRTSTTDANGEYFFTDMIIEPRHVQVYDFTGVYLSVLYYQDVIADELHVLSRDVILPDLTTPPKSLPIATGGTVLLADGALELTLPPNSLEYPLGYDEEVIQAERLAGEEIPPYDVEPWLEQKEGSFAFALYPHKIQTSESASFKVKTGITQPEGTKYQIWTAFFTEATLHRVGTATVDANGHLVSDADAMVKDLTTIVLIPDLPVSEDTADAGMADVLIPDAGSHTSLGDAGN